MAENTNLAIPTQEIVSPLQRRRQVFVAYSYKLYPKNDYRKFYRELEKQYDVTFIFADETISNMHIMKKIESYIRNSDFSIFDVSGWNPNVTLELGFAMALNDNWYIAFDPSKTEINDVPSDLRGWDRIEYRSYTELQTKLIILMEQHYQKRKQPSIDEFLGSRRPQVLDLLAKSPGLTAIALSQMLDLNVQVLQLVLQPLLAEGKLTGKGKTRGRKYYLANSSPMEHVKAIKPN